MPNRRLTAEELVHANALLVDIRGMLKLLTGDDTALLFAYRRKVFKELGYDERSKPAVRVKLKRQKRIEQSGLCALCSTDLPTFDTVLDRLVAKDGYTKDNTRLICRPCDVKVQTQRGFA